MMHAQCPLPVYYSQVKSECSLSVNSFWLQEVNGPAEGDDSKIIQVNSCVALGCTNKAGSGVSFHKIPCDTETQKLWLIAVNLLSNLF